MEYIGLLPGTGILRVWHDDTQAGKMMVKISCPGDIFPGRPSFWPSYVLTIFWNDGGMDPLFSESDISRFQAIWHKLYGEELSHDRALSEATALVRTVYLIFSTVSHIEREENLRSGSTRQPSKEMVFEKPEYEG